MNLALFHGLSKSQEHVDLVKKENMIRIYIKSKDGVIHQLLTVGVKETEIKSNIACMQTNKFSETN